MGPSAGAWPPRCSSPVHLDTPSVRPPCPPAASTGGHISGSGHLHLSVLPAQPERHLGGHAGGGGAQAEAQGTVRQVGARLRALLGREPGIGQVTSLGSGDMAGAPPPPPQVTNQLHRVCLLATCAPPAGWPWTRCSSNRTFEGGPLTQHGGARGSSGPYQQLTRPGTCARIWVAVSRVFPTFSRLPPAAPDTPPSTHHLLLLLLLRHLGSFPYHPRGPPPFCTCR